MSKPTAAAPSESEPEYVRLASAARRFDVAPSTLVAAIRRGELRAVRLGERGHWRVSRESLRQLTEREEKRDVDVR